ncbi:hypothetical protein K8Z61_15510 [Nocardioides sp. TRM66260-LWL]|uniref:hypothetical protein n=1 Tax=Nocardioides sp. TRM66260-LWL TaxID=2874478 RepID=UPI001CC388D0|nr:hypothetical protein [Nocardioides sp. TRM66260-LWL]MBZ5735900.1 hypothetical protein [Nocardioides sp. TRM66260-LWL]
MTTTTVPLLVRAAEEGTHSASPNPYLIGAIALGVLLILLLALVTFGNGREHS